MIAIGTRQHWLDELGSLIRALSGAFLIGIPLLYTMEMWWIGAHAPLWKIIAFLVLTFLIDFYLAFSAGFRRGRGSWFDHFDQAIDSVAIGLLASAAILVILNRIQLSDPLDTTLGKIMLQAVPLSIGAAVANSILAAQSGDDRSREEGEDDQQHQDAPPPAWKRTLLDIGATITGGLFIGLSIAPTEEIPMLSAEMTGLHEIALVIITLLITRMIVFEAGFAPERRHRARGGAFQTPWSETGLAYIVCLLTSATLLYLLNQIQFDDPLQTIISRTVVLALPISIGGAAGRIIT